MGYYLLDNPNPNGPFYYTSRRGSIVAIVVHITAGLEDLDATDDHSAEATARYAATTDRPVSWHSGSDSDTVFDLLPASYTAFQCRGYNSRTYGHEISKKHTDWRPEVEPWETKTLKLAGRHLGDKARRLGIPIRKASKAEVDHAIATNGPAVGFISHSELDPTRRSDPGWVDVGGGVRIDTFPWGEFLGYARNDEPEPEPRKVYKKMYYFVISDSGDGKVWLTDMMTKRHMRDQDMLNQATFLLSSAGAPVVKLDRTRPWPAHTVDSIPVVG